MSDEIFDMCRPKDPYQITLDDLIDSGTTPLTAFCKPISRPGRNCYQYFVRFERLLELRKPRDDPGRESRRGASVDLITVVVYFFKIYFFNKIHRFVLVSFDQGHSSDE